MAKIVNKVRSGKQGSVSGILIRQMIQDITATSTGHKLSNGEYRKKPIEPEWICPRRYELEKVQMENFGMEYLSPKMLKNNRVILQLHGGGYIGPMKNIYRRFATLYSKALDDGRVLTIDYRVAPEHPFPAALEDAYTAYCWLLERYEADQIIVVGDSAGGGLSMALCHYLKDKNIKLPKLLIAMSPWTDLTASGESYVLNYEKDPLFGRTEDSMLRNSDYIGDTDPRNPYLSPLYGDFKSFPPMLIQVGSYEMLLSDSLNVAKKAKEAGVKVKCTVYEGMFHAFQMACGLLPESRMAWNEVRRALGHV